MGKAPKPACSICHGPVRPRSENPAAPFCSPRCKVIDLGRWLDGSYRIPGPPASLDGSTADLEDDEAEGRRRTE